MIRMIVKPKMNQLNKRNRRIRNRNCNIISAIRIESIDLPPISVSRCSKIVSLRQTRPFPLDRPPSPPSIFDDDPRDTRCTFIWPWSPWLIETHIALSVIRCSLYQLEDIDTMVYAVFELMDLRWFDSMHD